MYMLFTNLVKVYDKVKTVYKVKSSFRHSDSSPCDRRMQRQESISRILTGLTVALTDTLFLKLKCVFAVYWIHKILAYTSTLERAFSNRRQCDALAIAQVCG